MEIRSFTFNPFQTNCYIAHDQGEAVLIDPACLLPEEFAVVESYVRDQELELRHLLLTHAHIDHIFGCAHFVRLFGKTFKMHRADLPLIDHAEEQARMFGVDLERPPRPSEFLEEGDDVRFGSVTWEVLHTPGHSPGSVCFHDRENAVMISGDVLFQGSIGRTDLWQGSLPELMTSIFQKIMSLDDDTVLYPGHGPKTAIGRERTSNPFLAHGFAAG